MLTVLVTGSTGFIGSHLVKRLREDGEKVVSLIHDEPVWTPWLREALGGTVMVRGDIRDFDMLKRVISHYEVNKVFHLAALSIVKHAYKDPIGTYDINLMGTVKLLEACRQLDVKRILVQSTDKIFGNQRGANRETRYSPTEPYGTSKICVDVAAQSFARTYGMDILITRCCNVYGYDWNNRVVPNTIRACLRNEPPVIFKDDASLRQYIHISDTNRTFIELMDTKMTGTVNIATSEVFNQEDIVLEVLKYFPELKPRYVEKPELKEITAQSMIPDYPKVYIPFEEGIQLTIDAFRKWEKQL